MNQRHISGILAAIVILYLTAAIVIADNLPVTVAMGAPFPTPWTGIINVTNYTEVTVAPQMLNRTRGHIWVLNVKETQNTHRWIGYVGNITGNISLQDDTGNNLYEWNLNITTGEMYATRFSGGATPDPLRTGKQYDSGQVGAAYQYVDWTNMRCAVPHMIHNESGRLGHNSLIDNDALNRTFRNSTSFHTNGMDFTVADKYIDVSANNCSGTFLNTNPDAQGTSYWQMVVLEDGIVDYADGDLVYAAIVENNAVGFNGKTYDFQILLPQYGAVLNGGENGVEDSDNIKQNIAYYFYVELIGEGWPNSS